MSLLFWKVDIFLLNLYNFIDENFDFDLFEILQARKKGQVGLRQLATFLVILLKYVIS